MGLGESIRNSDVPVVLLLLLMYVDILCRDDSNTSYLVATTAVYY